MILVTSLLPVTESGSSQNTAVRSVDGSGALGDSVKVSASDSLKTTKSFAI